MKQEYPTKEDAEAFCASVSEVDCIHNPATAAMIMKQKCLSLCDAYLALREEVKEADRKAGEARRHWEYMRDRQHAHDDWLRKAKEQWGVHENTSFDVVWNECLQLKADNEALMEDYKEANVLLNGYDKLLTKLRDQRDKDQEEIRKFHADNEALRAKLAQVEQASQRIIGNMIGEQQHCTY